MKKDAQFTFRMPSDLRIELQNIAAHEGRSIAQVCEAFLRAGAAAYSKSGGEFLQRFVTRSSKKRSSL